MVFHDAARWLATLQFQADRLCERKERIRQGLDLITLVPHADDAELPFVTRYGSLASLYEDIHALLTKLRTFED